MLRAACMTTMRGDAGASTAATAGHRRSRTKPMRLRKLTHHSAPLALHPQPFPFVVIKVSSHQCSREWCLNAQALCVKPLSASATSLSSQV